MNQILLLQSSYPKYHLPGPLLESPSDEIWYLQAASPHRNWGRPIALALHVLYSTYMSCTTLPKPKTVHYK